MGSAFSTLVGPKRAFSAFPRFKTCVSNTAFPLRFSKTGQGQAGSAFRECASVAFRHARFWSCGSAGPLRYESPEFFVEVTELLEGGNLRERVDESLQLPRRVVGFVSFQLAEALSYLHQRGIIHRDVRPEQILFFQRLRDKKKTHKLFGLN